MKKGILCFLGRFTLAMGLSLSCLSQQNPQPPPTAEQVLTRFAEAVGGATAYDNIKTKVITENHVDWDGRRTQDEMYWKSPDKWLNIEPKSHADVRCGYDGSVLWTQEGKHKPKLLKGAVGYDVKNDVAFEDALRWRDKFKKTDYVGEVDVLGRRAYALNVIGNRPATLYFDKQTGLLLKRDTRWEQSYVAIYYSDYVDTTGAKVPWRIEYVHFKTGKKFITQVTEVKTNVPLDDAIFAMPMP